jgi:hypothetical protein
MATRRKISGFWTEVHRSVSEDEVKVTVCCCFSPGDTSRRCAKAAGNKAPCRCDCHRKPRREPAVFSHCNVCGVPLRTPDEDKMGMCERCAAE